MNESNYSCDNDYYWQLVEFELKQYTGESLKEILEDSDLRRLIHLSNYLTFIGHVRI